MALIPIDSLRRQVMNILDKTDPPGGLELLSYKRNRSIALIARHEGGFRVIERGFTEQDCCIESADLARALKIMIKREFPRSRKVRVFKFSDPEELHRPRQRI